MNIVIIVVGILILLPGTSFFWYKIFNKRRIDELRKISKEYRLELTFKQYSLTTNISANEHYPLRVLMGSVRGHSVIIEDGFTTYMFGPLWYLYILSSTGRSSCFIPQTDITLDGAKQDSKNVDLLGLHIKLAQASYQDIKIALDNLS